MGLDITHILREWPHEPGQLSVRRIVGDHGREFIQMRLDLGLLQMECSGRPDGQRPHEHESLLAYYEHMLALHRQRHGTEEEFELDEQACELLRAEGVMYYHRYLAEFVLEDYDAVVRDTTRNIRLFDLCAKHAAEESDRFVLEQFRPYVLMMQARAKARRELRDSRPKAALATARRGIADIRRIYARFGQDDEGWLGGGEIELLQALAKEAESRIPVDPLQKLRTELARAVKEERYEDAAVLRDRIQRAVGDEDADGD